MKNIEKYIIIILFQFLIISCGIPPQNTADSENEAKKNQSNLSWFYVFNIRKDNNSSTSIITLISKKEIAGKMKTESTKRSANYLTLHLYSGKQVVDTLYIDHPLYKHYEYAAENGEFKYKDTIINTTDFVLRAPKNINEIKIFETLKNQSRKQLNLKSF